MIIALLAGTVMAWAMIFPARNHDKQHGLTPTKRTPK